MEEKEFVSIGKITKAHGIKGNWLASIYFLDLDILKNIESIFLNIEGTFVPFFIEDFRHLASKKNIFILSFKKNPSSNLGSDLKNFELFFPHHLLSKKDQKKFQPNEFIGFSIKNTQNEEIAKIIDIQENFLQPLIVISYKGKQVFIPFVDAFVKKINKKEKYFLVELPLGLLEINS